MPLKTSRGILLLVVVVLLIFSAVILYHYDSFNPAIFPPHLLRVAPLGDITVSDRMLKGSERISGDLAGPEDIAYDSKSGLMYTGCADGWIRRITVNVSMADCAVENWVNTGGRPLGIAMGQGPNDREVIVADAEKGLLKVRDGEVELLVDEAEGLKFKLTDGVDVSNDGKIYFTDASYKYNLRQFMLDLLEGRPHGRLLRYDPVTKITTVLVQDLFFANGVVVSPDQHHVIFCETTMRRCTKYHLQGEKKGTMDTFVDGLPGFPDNIHWDGNGHYLIALAAGITPLWNAVFKYPIFRKMLSTMIRYTGSGYFETDAGVLMVDLEGKPVACYHDPRSMLISSAILIGEHHLYCGSVSSPYIIRVDLTKFLP